MIKFGFFYEIILCKHFCIWICNWKCIFSLDILHVVAKVLRKSCKIWRKVAKAISWQIFFLPKTSREVYNTWLNILSFFFYEWNEPGFFFRAWLSPYREVVLRRYIQIQIPYIMVKYHGRALNTYKLTF